MNEEVVDTTKLKKNVIDKEVFNCEIDICKEMSEEKNACCWGKCKDCGVVLLLHKLYKGELIDDADEIKKLKNEILN